jgi:SAM-dependent methyltransferase
MATATTPQHYTADRPENSTTSVDANSADAYGIAAAADLPFENCSFDLVVAYNVLMDVEDVPAALKEIRRVLRPSGTLVISIVHPFADRGRFAGPDADAPFVLQKSYFGRERFEDTEVRNGLQMHFAGWGVFMGALMPRISPR